MPPAVVLVEQLRGLGLAEDATVMVHASLRALGPNDGGARTVIESILAALGPTGTMMMVLGADADEPFVAAQTEVDVQDMGVLAEVFRTWPGVQVTDHAAARYAACGPGATALLNEPPLHDYHGPGSPLAHLVDAGGSVLRLGADVETVTLTHLAEYAADVPNKRRVRRRYVRADTGEQWIDSLDDDDGIVDWPGGDYFGQILQDYVAGGHARVGMVGAATAELFAAASFVRFATRWMEHALVP